MTDGANNRRKIAADADASQIDALLAEYAEQLFKGLTQ
jgi:hypothetical protein